MTEPKWTPGPWHPGHFVDPESSCQCRAILSEAHAGSVAEINVWNGIAMIADGSNDAPPLDEAIANAHLISAAPELYEALRPFIRHYASWMDDYPDETEPAVYPKHTIGELRRARAALGKARGET